MQERFELSGQHHVHENERERHGHQKVVSAACQLLALADANAAVAGVHVEIRGELLQFRNDIGLRSARQKVASYGDLALAIQAIDARRSCSRLDADYLIEAYRTAL